MMENLARIENALPWDLASDAAYQAWRSVKLEAAMGQTGPSFVEIGELGNPTERECRELTQSCERQNLVLYAVRNPAGDQTVVRDELRRFTNHFRLKIAERHRSAGEGGIVALTVTDRPVQRGYIPYSRKAMNWHTDGYYNAPGNQIRSMVLHCVTPAGSGGRNQFLDPEIAYIRLRDENPDFIAALMHTDAMTIPENREADGGLRPVSVGPVFSVDAATGHLAMRYTARTRSISWRNDAVTRQAVSFLQSLLEAGDPLMQTVRLEAGQGILCNNVLHNRTGFDPDTSEDSGRLVFRIRFHNRVSGS